MDKQKDRPELPKEIPALCIVNMIEGRGYPRCIEPLIEEAKRVAFDKGVRRGTTIRNINWCSENHQRHGKKMAKAREEAKREERERVLNDLKDSLELIIRFMDMPEARRGITDALRITLKDMMIGAWQAIKEEK